MNHFSGAKRASMNQPHIQPSLAPQNYVKDADTASFMADVVQLSQQVPVIVDFWAPWCEPCKQLGPVLEKAVNAKGGAVRMVKVDIDQNPQIAQAMRVQSIPAVFVFSGGQPVDGFMGVQPEAQVKEFVEKAAKLGLPMDAPQAVDIKSMLAQADAFAAEGKHDHAAALYQEILGVDGASAPAHIGFIRALLALNALSQAQQVFDHTPEEVKKDKNWSSVVQAMALAEKAGSVGAAADLKSKVEAEPKNHQARQDYALALYAEGAREEAVDQLLKIVRADRKWNEESARKELVTIFEALGPMDPITIAARKQLSSILFS
jgi:putative thioredoxin